jgi:hypothetical protein
MTPFQPTKPYLFVAGITPVGRPGRHRVAEMSPLFRYCRLMCQVGGSWREGLAAVAGFRPALVEAIAHDNATYTAYDARRTKLTSLRLKGGDHFNFPTRDFNSQQLHVLSVLREQFIERPPREVNTVYCFHGPRLEHVDSICKNGMVSVRKMDAGYFGSGCYFTLNIEYALRYAKGHFDEIPRAPPADGRYPVIMFAAWIGMAYPVTPDTDYSNGPDQPSNYFGRPLKPGFDCHVVCVNQSSGFQSVNRSECQYAELVMDQESQMLPIAVLWFEEN